MPTLSWLENNYSLTEFYVSTYESVVRDDQVLHLCIKFDVTCPFADFWCFYYDTLTELGTAMLREQIFNETVLFFYAS